MLVSISRHRNALINSIYNLNVWGFAPLRKEKLSSDIVSMLIDELWHALPHTYCSPLKELSVLKFHRSCLFSLYCCKTKIVTQFNLFKQSQSNFSGSVFKKIMYTCKLWKSSLCFNLHHKLRCCWPVRY